MLSSRLKLSSIFVTFSLLFFRVARSQNAGKPIDASDEDDSDGDFLEIIKSPWFVDKTSMIREFLESENPYVEVTIPPRFGRSINLSMMKYFFDINLDETDGFSLVTQKETTKSYKLFTDPELNLSISNHKDFINQYLGEFIVIHFSLKDLHGKTMEQKVDTLNRIFYHQVCKKYIKWFDHFRDYLYSKSTSAAKILEQIIKGNGYDSRILESNLAFLVSALKKYYKKDVMLLVDDYHSPAMNAMLMDQDPTRIVHFINGMFNQIIQPSYPSHGVERALLVGTFSVANATVVRNQSVLDNVHFCAFLGNHVLSKFYGFLPHEMRQLYDKIPNLDEKEETAVAEYCNGFAIEGTAIKLYNPASVTRYLNKRAQSVVPIPFETPLLKTGPIPILMNASMNHDDSRKMMLKLLQQGTAELGEYHNNTIVVYKQLVRGVIDGNNTFYCDAFKNFLFYNGYFTRDSFDVYRIPNLEIKRQFQHVVHTFYRGKNVNLELVGRQFRNILHYRGNLTDDKIRLIREIFQQEFEQFVNRTKSLKLEINDREIKSFFHVALDATYFADKPAKELQIYNNARADGATNLILVDTNDQIALIAEFKYLQDVKLATKLAQTHRIAHIYDVKSIVYAGIAIDDRLNVKLDVKVKICSEE